MPTPPLQRPTWHLILLPLAVYSIAAVLLRGWIVDDAGITFAYAQNAAAGHGLVAQPGQSPVEGYSNFLWLVALLPFFKLGWFHVIWVPKLVSFALVTATFGQLAIVLRRHLQLASSATVLALMLLAANPAFAVWTTSGLENPLLALLVARAWFLLADWTDGPLARPGRAVTLGVTAAALAMTRPDGLLYCAALPAIVVILGRARRPTWRQAAIVAASSTVVCVLFLGHRWLTFHDFVPNTFRAKGGPGLAGIAGLLIVAPDAAQAWIALHQSIGSKVAGWLAVLLVAVPLQVWRAGRLSRAQEASFLLYLCAATEFVLLPQDWMGEYRFATPFLVVGLPWLVWCGQELVMATKSAPLRQRRIVGGLVAAFVLASFVVDAKRLRTFCLRPTVPLASVIAHTAEPFNRLARRLEVRDPSLLAPDLGGLLLQSDLAIIDLAMLCDRTVAQTLDKDQPRFYSYIFDQRKPTFIHTHDYWTWLAKFDADPRFRRDYVAIREYVDQDVKERFGRELLSGDFVRKSALADHNVSIAELATLLKTAQE